MIAYYIEDSVTGNRWSRNRWAKSDSLPDFYKTRIPADTQLNQGKVGISVYFDPSIKPVIRVANITF